MVSVGSTIFSDSQSSNINFSGIFAPTFETTLTIREAGVTEESREGGIGSSVSWLACFEVLREP